jgi:hypothetical protein
MKNLRKVLAVVLVVCLAFGMMVMASAKTSAEYADAASITHKEAVDVFSGAGIMTGSDGTNWNPTGTFTREQAAKVIASLLSANAGKFKVSVSSFSDVLVTDWSSPYIEYCASKGIINGTGDGTFAPKAPVTGSAFAKMLLTALGYGKNNEYVGANWEINVLDDALRLKILTLDVNYSAAATREQVALYALNAIGLIQQKYSKDTGEYSNVTGDPTLGDKIGLKKVSTPANGVAGHVYKLNGVAITPFYAVDIVLATSKDGTKVTAYTSTSSTKYVAPFAAACAYTYNGEAVQVVDDTDPTGGAGQLYVGSDNILRVAQGANADYNGVGDNDDAEYTVRGAIVNLIDNPATVDKDVFKVNIVEKKVGVIDLYGAGMTVTPVLNLPSNVKIDLETVADIEGTEKTVVGYEGLAKGDTILYYKMGTTTYVEKAASFTGAVTSIAGTTYTIGGAAYKMSQLANKTASVPALGNTTATYFIDDGGFIVNITGPAPVVPTNYAMVIQYSYTAANALLGTAASSKAQLLLTDGTTAVYDLITNNGLVANDALAVGQLVKFVATDKTITGLTKITGDVLAAGGALDIDQYDTTVTINSTTDANDGTYYLTSSTVFFFAHDDDNSGSIVDDDDDSYGVVVGNAKIKDDSAAAVGQTIYFSATTAAPKAIKAIVLRSDFAGQAAGTPTYAYVTNATPTQTQETVSGILRTVYTYNAIVNGTATTIKSLTNKDGDTNDIAVGLYSVAATNDFYAYTKITMEQDDAVINIVDPSYVVIGDSTVIDILPTTVTYKATKDAFGKITALTAEPMAMVPGKTLVADIDVNAGDAVVAIFWYENTQTANVSFATAPGTIAVNQATRAVTVNVANGVNSVVLTGTALATQTVAKGGTDAAFVTVAGSGTVAPTFTVNTTAIAGVGGGSYTFTITVTEAGMYSVVYTVTVNVAA